MSDSASNSNYSLASSIHEDSLSEPTHTNTSVASDRSDPNRPVNRRGYYIRTDIAHSDGGESFELNNAHVMPNINDNITESVADAGAVPAFPINILDSVTQRVLWRAGTLQRDELSSQRITENTQVTGVLIPSFRDFFSTQ